LILHCYAEPRGRRRFVKISLRGDLENGIFILQVGEAIYSDPVEGDCFVDLASPSLLAMTSDRNSEATRRVAPDETIFIWMIPMRTDGTPLLPAYTLSHQPYNREPDTSWNLGNYLTGFTGKADPRYVFAQVH
jgi:hypothetical protein